MSDRRDARDMLERAEHAATAGDFASADELLRSATRIQEETLGPLHPDVANTFNNLAIVAEQTGNLGDAETFYRRAVAIASASLPPEHPMVVASRENLESFCRARGYVDSMPLHRSRRGTPTSDQRPRLPNGHWWLPPRLLLSALRARRTRRRSRQRRPFRPGPFPVHRCRSPQDSIPGGPVTARSSHLIVWMAMPLSFSWLCCSCCDRGRLATRPHPASCGCRAAATRRYAAWARHDRTAGAAEDRTSSRQSGRR